MICGQDIHILNKQQLTKMDKKQMKWNLDVLTSQGT